MTLKKYQIVMPNGDIIGVVADRMQNHDGDLIFHLGNDVVGEARYWQAWTYIGDVSEQAKAPPTPTMFDPKYDAGTAYVRETIERLGNTPPHSITKVDL